MILPAILQTDFAEIKKEIKMVEDVAKVVHIDIADGKLVGGMTYLDVEKLNQIDSPAKIELHLMVVAPVNYLPQTPKNVIRIVSQVESGNIQDFIDKTRALGLRTGLSVSPQTQISALDKFLSQIDYVQFMTIEPGKQGQPFIPEVLDKIKEFKQKHPDIETQVDGHINKRHIIELERLGIDHYAVGSVIFKSACPTCEEIELEKLID